jgi:hypothetical protein
MLKCYFQKKQRKSADAFGLRSFCLCCFTQLALTSVLLHVKRPAAHAYTSDERRCAVGLCIINFHVGAQRCHYAYTAVMCRVVEFNMSHYSYTLHCEFLASC